MASDLWTQAIKSPNVIISLNLAALIIATAGNKKLRRPMPGFELHRPEPSAI
jgi:hypothetical protein